MAAGPTSAGEIDFDGDELLFFGYPAYSIIDDVDYEKTSASGTTTTKTGTAS